jgi:hypothetical protein
MSTTALARSRAPLALLGEGREAITFPGDVRLSPRAHLYFAYGADLCEALLRRRCPDLRVVGSASLRGYQLAFAGESRRWDGATLTLVPRADAHVGGLLYLVSGVSLAGLDRAQGAPRVYERVTVPGVDARGTRADAHAYCMRPPLVGGLPSEAYYGLVTSEYRRLGFDTAALVDALERAVSGAPLARRTTR